jgi:two-component system chemotaxis response regulator CheB
MANGRRGGRVNVHAASYADKKEQPVPRRDIVVIGASAGGVEALRDLVRELPADLPAALFVVLHVPADVTSVLATILDRAGKLPAVSARSGMNVTPGRIHVAPPGCHLVLQGTAMELSNGPKENGMRPAIDPLFRSAARDYRSRVIGIVLSGTLDDGSAGLFAVKHGGGLAVVQSADDALFAGMPSNAASVVDVDFSLPARDIGRLLPSLIEKPMEQTGVDAMSQDMDRELKVGVGPTDAVQDSTHPGEPSAYTCPECHGTLWEVRAGEFAHFRCRVGHAYSAESLGAAQNEAVEAALWTALRALEERRSMVQRMAVRARDRGQSRLAERFDDQAAGLLQHETTLQDVLHVGLLRPDGIPTDDTSGSGIAAT